MLQSDINVDAGTCEATVEIIGARMNVDQSRGSRIAGNREVT